MDRAGDDRTKNRIHAVLHANLIPPFSGKLFLGPGWKWLAEQPLCAHERAAVDRWLTGLDAMEGELRQPRRRLPPLASATTGCGDL